MRTATGQGATLGVPQHEALELIARHAGADAGSRSFRHQSHHINACVHNEQPTGTSLRTSDLRWPLLQRLHRAGRRIHPILPLELIPAMRGGQRKTAPIRLRPKTIGHPFDVQRSGTTAIVSEHDRNGVRPAQQCARSSANFEWRWVAIGSVVPPSPVDI